MLRSWKWWARAAGAGAVALAMGCSSKSGGTGGSGDGAASDSGSDDGGSVSSGDGNCGAIELPMDAAAAAACSMCLTANCSAELATCGMDCVCVSGVECLAANMDNATLCPSALAALGAGNVGLMAIGACLPMKCENPCHGIDAAAD
jgi:hypothetical protein